MGQYDQAILQELQRQSKILERIAGQIEKVTGKVSQAIADLPQRPGFVTAEEARTDPFPIGTRCQDKDGDVWTKLPGGSGWSLRRGATLPHTLEYIADVYGPLTMVERGGE